MLISVLFGNSFWLVMECIVRRHAHWMANVSPTLADLAPGEQATVIDLQGGPGFIGRMSALGFTPGANVRIIRNSGHGPIIVSILDTQIALGRGRAKRVSVRR